MKEYTAIAVINAPAATVWRVLTDARGYADWNPEIIGIVGEMALGNRIKARVRLGSGAVRSVPMRVTTFRPEALMEWTGGMPFGLFIGLRTFSVTPKGDAAEFRLHLRMSGLLSPMIIKSVGDRQPEVDSFAAALKVRAESGLIGT
jgi:hypothetical protein